MKEFCVDIAYGDGLTARCQHSTVQLQLFSSTITKEFLCKLDRFRVQFVGNVFFSVYVFNNLNISH